MRWGLVVVGRLWVGGTGVVVVVVVVGFSSSKDLVRGRGGGLMYVLSDLRDWVSGVEEGEEAEELVFVVVGEIAAGLPSVRVIATG